VHGAGTAYNHISAEFLSDMKNGNDKNKDTSIPTGV
jgi:hypothetical protein